MLGLILSVCIAILRLGPSMRSDMEKSSARDSLFLFASAYHSIVNIRGPYSGNTNGTGLTCLPMWLVNCDSQPEDTLLCDTALQNWIQQGMFGPQMVTFGAWGGRFGTKIVTKSKTQLCLAFGQWFCLPGGSVGALRASPGPFFDPPGPPKVYIWGPRVFDRGCKCQAHLAACISRFLPQTRPPKLDKTRHLLNLVSGFIRCWRTRRHRFPNKHISVYFLYKML